MKIYRNKNWNKN